MSSELKIEKIECFHADAGIRNFDFVKITSESGLAGWSEYNEAFGGKGLTSIIENIAPLLTGKDARATEEIIAYVTAIRRQALGGAVHQAIAAIENALLDLKARGLGIPVYELLGGPIRKEIEVYWSHCATYRVSHPEHLGNVKPVRTLDDIRENGKEVAKNGYRGLKTNVLLLDGEPRGHVPGYARGDTFPGLNAERVHTQVIADQLAAFREGAGDNMNIHVDLNFNYKTEGYVKMARAMAPFDLSWVEIDTRDPDALRYIRDQVEMPVASGECLFGRREYKPFFDRQSMDVALIDVPWNGLTESVRIASFAEMIEMNVAPHNFYGPLASMMSAHFCAVVPNLRVMEIDPDTVPWYEEFVTVAPVVANGMLQLPDGPGWGTEIDEAALVKYPAKVSVPVVR